MKRLEAHTAAAMVLDRIIENGRPQAVFLIKGRVRTATPDTKSGFVYATRFQHLLIGTYSETAKVMDIAEDIYDFCGHLIDAR